MTEATIAICTIYMIAFLSRFTESPLMAMLGIALCFVCYMTSNWVVRRSDAYELVKLKRELR